MFRLLAIFGVVAAFGATLYYSGDYLEAWESPQPAAKAAQAPARSKKKAKRAHRARKAKRRVTREPAWLRELNTICRRAQAEAEAIRPPSGPADAVRYFEQFTRLSTRWNDQASAALRRSPGHQREVNRLLRLFERDEAVLQGLVAAARNGQYQRLEGSLRSLIAVAKSENRLLERIGAIDCTVAPEVLDLYS